MIDYDIVDFISDICSYLEIDVPLIDKLPESLPDSILAAAKPATNTIYIKDNAKHDLSLYFCLSHELRHIWQYKNSQMYFDNYLPSSMLETEKYNSQPAEIDANAFAIIVMADYFGVKPTLPFSEKLCLKIENRVTQIVNGEQFPIK